MSELDNTYRAILIPSINKLIKGYTVSSLLKEYLQNTDDAATTELKFICCRRLYKQLNDTRFLKATGLLAYK